jgi:cytidylate kinase
MYRAVALAAIRRGIDPSDGDALVVLARNVELTVGVQPADGSDWVLLDGDDVSTSIRSDDVTSVVSAVAAHPAVRAELVERQRAWVEERGAGVVEGRDITSVVLPHADVKVYLTADPTERAARRARELGVEDEQARVAAAIGRRDDLDSSRAASPLLIAEGATVVDSTRKSVDEVVDEILALL